MQRLVFVHQQSSSENLIDCIEFFRYLTRRLSHLLLNPIYIVVDNSIDSHHITDGIHFVPSGNEFREFSGWEVGLDYARNSIGIKFSPYIFSNDTFLTHRVFDRAIRNAFINCFQSAIDNERAIICGDVDLIHAEPPYFLSSTFDRYVSTYLICINSKGMDLVDTFLRRDDLKILFEERPNTVSVLNRSMSFYKTDYAKFLEGHLYRFDVKNRYRWYGSQKLMITNYNKMKLKLLSVIIEHSITQLLVAKGALMIDVKKYVRRSFWEAACFYLNKIVYSIDWRIRKVRLKYFK